MGTLRTSVGSIVVGAGLQETQIGMLSSMETRQGEKCDFLGTECDRIGGSNEGHYKGKGRVTEPRNSLAHLESVLTFDL